MIEKIINYFQDLFKQDITSEIRERITNPFFVALIFSWIINNWKLTYTFFNLDYKTSLADRIAAIEVFVNKPDAKYDLLWFPIIYALLAIILFSITKELASLITLFFHKRVKPLIYRLLDKDRLVTKDAHNELKNKLFRVQDAYEELRDEMSGYSDENRALKTSTEESKRKFNREVQKEESTRFKYFKFHNQSVLQKFPDKDDHYLETPLNLQEKSYEIILKPRTNVKHWRFGIMLSRNTSFPAQEVRHQKKYPVFHIERNVDEAGLRWSYYDEGLNNSNGATRISQYSDQQVSLVFSMINGKISVEILDENRKQAMDSPQIVNNVIYAKVFAWADSKTPFEFDAIIKSTSPD